MKSRLRLAAIGLIYTTLLATIVGIVSSCNKVEKEELPRFFELNTPPTARITDTIDYFDPMGYYYSHRNIVIGCILKDSNENDTLFTRWDFESDGNWDVDWTQEPMRGRSIKVHGFKHKVRFESAGKKLITLEVRDHQGGKSRDTVSIKVIDSTGDIYNTPPDFKEFKRPSNRHIPSDVTFSWQFNDPQGHDMSYDIYIYKSGDEPGQAFATNLKTTSFKTDLDANTDYEYKVVATDEFGATMESHSEKVSICNTPGPCPGRPFVYDADGNKYATVEICGNCWLKSNINSNTMHETNGNTRLRLKYCRDDQWSNCEIDGGYYNIALATTIYGPTRTQAVCPDGFHLPHSGDFSGLLSYSELENVLAGGSTGIDLNLAGYLENQSNPIEYGETAYYWCGIVSKSAAQLYIIKKNGEIRTEQVRSLPSSKVAPIRCVDIP